MKHSIYSAVFTAPNCFRTVIHNTGIECYYSVCVGNKVNLDGVKQHECWIPSYKPSYTKSFFGVCKVINEDITFTKTPYKQCYPVTYTQHFGFIIFRCFTHFEDMKSIDIMMMENYCAIKDAIRDYKFLY